MHEESCPSDLSRERFETIRPLLDAQAHQARPVVRAKSADRQRLHGKAFAQSVREILSEQVSVQVAKRSELRTFKVIPKRWVVERCFAWLEKGW